MDEIACAGQVNHARIVGRDVSLEIGFDAKKSGKGLTPELSGGPYGLLE